MLQRVQPGTVAARLTSRHFGWRWGSKNLSHLVKRASVNLCTRRYRSVFFGQLKTASTAGTPIVSIFSPCGINVGYSSLVNSPSVYWSVKVLEKGIGTK